MSDLIRLVDHIFEHGGQHDFFVVLVAGIFISGWIADLIKKLAKIDYDHSSKTLY